MLPLYTILQNWSRHLELESAEQWPHDRAAVSSSSPYAHPPNPRNWMQF